MPTCDDCGKEVPAAELIDLNAGLDIIAPWNVCPDCYAEIKEEEAELDQMESEFFGMGNYKPEND